MASVSASTLESWMRRCVELAREAAESGNYALGSLVGMNDDILAASGSSLIGSNNDPSAHPEMVVIREAARKMDSRYLPGAVLVTTLEPCPMCTSAAVWAKMASVAFGATQEDAVAWASAHPSDRYTWRQIGIHARTVIDAGMPRLDLHEGILREECLTLFELTGR